MSIVTIHPLEFIKLNFSMKYGVILKKCLPLLLAFALIFACMLLVREYALMMESFNSSMSEIDFPPLRILPVGM